MKQDGSIDAAIVGGGPAGLAAALWLARFRRDIRLFDGGPTRNEATWAVHGYPGVPDLPPAELRRRMREQALGAGAMIVPARVRRVEGEKNSFQVVTDDGAHYVARRILLAFGRTDILPEIDGLADHLGISVFHCPDCDGPSVAGARVGVLGHERRAAALALYLLAWADSTVLLTHGHEPVLEPHVRQLLDRWGVDIRTDPVSAFEGRRGQLQRARFDGDAEPLDALFIRLGSRPGSDIADQLGCECDDEGHIRTGRAQETSIPGVFAAGDIAGHPHLVVAATAEGVRAALAIHRSLLPPEFEI